MKVKPLMPGYVGFNCPGCGGVHTVRVSGPNAWKWNGSTDAPSISPSILVTSGHFLGGASAKHCWCNFEERFGRKADFSCVRCHSFVEDGSIRFLEDCSHALAGQTVPLGPYRGVTYD